MRQHPHIIIKSGLLFITSVVLFVVLLMSMTERAVETVQSAVDWRRQPSEQMVHHNVGYSLTRAQPTVVNREVLTDQVTMRPLTDIYVDGPPRIVNITTTYATLLFTSSVPVVCSVVYGVDDTFGQIAQDANMNGGAIVDHRPQLTGLLPETEYLYRVQGSDANGIIYVSEVATFTTPAEPTQPSPQINVAALGDGAEILAVSSNFGGVENDQTWGAESAIDENPATAWSSNGDGNDAFIIVDLMEPSTLTGIEVWTRFMSDGTAQIFEFTVTTDPGNTDSETFGPFTLPNATRGYPFAIVGTSIAESIRLDVVDSSGGNTGLVEFKVFANNTVTATDTTRLDVFLPVTSQ